MTKVALASAAMVLVGLGVAAGRSHAARDTRPLAPGTHDVAITYDGRARSYRVFVPPGVSGTAPLPVVVNFHGGGSNAAGEERFSAMDLTAARLGFVVVYPNGTGVFRNALLTWNAGTCCGYAQQNRIDDVGFTLAVLDDVARRIDLDRRRIFATGMSNGAMMAYRLAADAADRIAAVAPVAGGMVVTSFHPSRPVPILDFHSVDDPRALYHGGLGPPFPGTRGRVRHPAMEAVLRRWARFDGCRMTPQVGPTMSQHRQTATRVAYVGCRDGAEVVHWRLTGVGHVWPGAQQTFPRWLRRILGEPTAVVDANELMWRFFEHHPLPLRPA